MNDRTISQILASEEKPPSDKCIQSEAEILKAEKFPFLVMYHFWPVHVR